MKSCNNLKLRARNLKTRFPKLFVIRFLELINLIKANSTTILIEFIRSNGSSRLLFVSLNFRVIFKIFTKFWVFIISNLYGHDIWVRRWHMVQNDFHFTLRQMMVWMGVQCPCPSSAGHCLVQNLHRVRAFFFNFFLASCL